MPQKENKRFTGFVAFYKDGNEVREKNNYFSSKTKRKKATNWHEVDKDKIVALEIFWKGQPKIRIDKDDHPDLKPSDWFFSHFGCLDMNTHETKVISRNIGFIKGDILTVYCVVEETGVVKVEHRPKP